MQTSMDQNSYATKPPFTTSPFLNCRKSLVIAVTNSNTKCIKCLLQARLQTLLKKLIMYRFLFFIILESRGLKSLIEAKKISAISNETAKTLTVLRNWLVNACPRLINFMPLMSWYGLCREDHCVGGNISCYCSYIHFHQEMISS